MLQYWSFSEKSFKKGVDRERACRRRIGLIRLFLKPPTKRPLTNWPTDHRPTYHRPNALTGNQPTTDQKKIWRPEIRKQILNEFLIKNMRFVINTISRMWVMIFWLKLECVIDKIKIKMKLIKYTTNNTETAFE